MTIPKIAQAGNLSKPILSVWIGGDEVTISESILDDDVNCEFSIFFIEDSGVVSIT